MGLIASIKEAFSPTKGGKSQERIQELWGKDSQRRKARERQWQLHVSMVLGNQWVGWNGTSVQTLAAPSWRVQAVDNKLFVRVRSKQTRLMEDMTPSAIPESAENIDVRRAKYKERLLSHVRREVKDAALRFRASQWVVVCGEVYTEVFWDESSGDTYAVDGGAFSEGDVAVKIWDPFAVWPGAGSSVGNNGGRLWTVDMIPVELARLKYNDAKITADATEGNDVKLRAAMESCFAGNANTGYGGESTGLEESTLVKVLREYRTKELPQGRKSIIINGKVVDEQPLLWDGMTHIVNYYQFNSYHGDAVEVRNSIQPQKSINRLESNWEEYVRTMCKGKILCHKSNNIKSSQFDSEHMEIVKYEGNGPKPEPWMPPPLPSDTGNLIGLKTATIDDVFSDHMASQGKSPASASGAAINYLTEEDARQHTPTRDEWLAGWSRTYEKCLDVIAGKSGIGGYDETRTITVLGENRRADVQRVVPDMLAGRNRVYIVCGGALPQNKTLRSETARRLFADGALGDPTLPETRRKLLKMIDAGLVDDVYDDTALDEIRAEKENERMQAGEEVAPRPEDDHGTHSWTTSLRFWRCSRRLFQVPPLRGCLLRATRQRWRVQRTCSRARRRARSPRPPLGLQHRKKEFCKCRMKCPYRAMASRMR
jgi:hypothetical protein